MSGAWVVEEMHNDYSTETIIGPFASYEEAKAYADACPSVPYLGPQFGVTQVESPEEFKRTLAARS